jgi:hypothetical protein
MDLMNLIPTTDVIDVVIKHPSTYEPLLNDDGSEMTITVYAPHSKEYKAAVHEQTNIRLKQMKSKGNRNSNVITAEELEKATIKMLAKTTKDWCITFAGEQPKFSVEVAKKLYEDVYWIKDQIEEAVDDSEVFTQD